VGKSAAERHVVRMSCLIEIDSPNFLRMRIATRRKAGLQRMTYPEADFSIRPEFTRRNVSAI
jgi:hypothetical protein